MNYSEAKYGESFYGFSDGSIPEILTYCNMYVNDTDYVVSLDGNGKFNEGLKVIFYFSTKSIDDLDNVYNIYDFKLHVSDTPDFTGPNTTIIDLTKDPSMAGCLFKGFSVNIPSNLIKSFDTNYDIYYKLEAKVNILSFWSAIYRFTLPGDKASYFITTALSKLSSIFNKGSGTNIRLIFDNVFNYLAKYVRKKELDFFNYYIHIASDKMIKEYYAKNIGVNYQDYLNVNHLDFREAIITFYRVAKFSPYMKSIKHFINIYLRSDLMYSNLFDSSMFYSYEDQSNGNIIYAYDDSNANDPKYFSYDNLYVYSYSKFSFKLKCEGIKNLVKSLLFNILPTGKYFYITYFDVNMIEKELE